MTGVAIVLTLLVVAFALTGPDRDGSDRAVVDHRVQTPGQPPLGRLRGARRETVTLGRSARRRRIDVTAFGNTRAGRRVLVVGCIHGTECAGTAVLRQLGGGCPPVGADVWMLDQLNPDGYRRGIRVNGRGVDLNRNFSSSWRPIGRRWDPEHSGPRAWSEPETRIVRRLVRRLRPQVTIWFHQQAQPLVRAWGGSEPAARRYARRARLPFHRLPWMAGTAPNWQNHAFPGTSSFVVELPHGALDLSAAIRHAAAIEHIAGYIGENRRALARAQR
jgi:protein MpaA